MGDPRFKNIEFKVGLFIFIALIMSFAFLTGFLITQNFFTSKVKVVFISESGEGLTKSMPVMYSGFQIARIYSIELRDDGLVELRAKIPVRYKKWVKPESQAKIQAQGVIGANAIVLAGGIDSKNDIEDGQTYKLTREQAIADLIKKFEPMLDNVRNILVNVDKTTTSAADKRQSIEDLIQGLGDLGGDVSKKEGSVGFLTRSDYLKNEVQTIMTKLQQAQDNLLVITEGINDRVTETKPAIADLDKGILAIKDGAEDIGKLARNIDNTVTKLQSTVNNANKISGDVADTTTNLKDLRQQTDDILNTSNRILLNLEEKWPFNSSTSRKAEERVKLP
jgi:phospholipid/cholesterol/gamma-HCH transport system substrate-binding protein